MAKELNVDFNFTGCKYYLPCGKCDKTNELCTHYAPYPIYPHYPNWWEYGPTWTSTDYNYTVTNHTTQIDPDNWIYESTTTNTKTKGVK